MTDHATTTDSDRIIAEGLAIANGFRERIAAIEKSREDQPAKLEKARAEADEAREQSLLIEPWTEELSTLRCYRGDGQPTGTVMHLPNLIAKEMFGARMAFDMLDCSDDSTGERIEEVRNRYFALLGGDTGNLFLVAFAALDTIATIVVPQLLDAIEQQASNWDTRVMLAEARAKSWRGRIAEHRGIPANEPSCDDVADSDTREPW
ncbi:hypothetical protein ORI20_27620 [Mycobacterium sp. CVI_P3]|uniref:ESX-1 secretion-associated protein EspA/EspE-like domain-containing protein n=1 Tax=Mycobacterium pinniadriaticum TaxID=2994102 RepID=A0ABT3SLR1_9MYCO|nr:hypothetical protein [Mycobacterium pinniadriaticum]MCX2934042.1 hypothetical protein [Mycobacterium pinniadriaticum]MCX2940461.1 hypothetical protein [Mycobacterium pinniadriaticum]